MNLIRRHKVIVSIAATVIVMNFLSSLVYEGGTFTGACQGGDLFTPGISGCNFVEYYFNYFNLAGNPFINPFDGLARLIRLADPGLLRADDPWSGPTTYDGSGTGR
jgi:hypothetical protein